MRPTKSHCYSSRGRGACGRGRRPHPRHERGSGNGGGPKGHVLVDRVLGRLGTSRSHPHRGIGCRLLLRRGHAGVGARGSVRLQLDARRVFSSGRQRRRHLGGPGSAPERDGGPSGPTDERRPCFGGLFPTVSRFRCRPWVTPSGNLVVCSTWWPCSSNLVPQKGSTPTALTRWLLRRSRRPNPLPSCACHFRLRG